MIAIIYLFIKKFKRKKERKFKLISFKRYFRYIKIFITKNTIILISLSSIISNTIITFQENRYDNLYKEGKINVLGIVVSNKEEKEYNVRYKIKVLKVNSSTKQKNTYIYIKLKRGNDLNLGDKIQITGEFSKGNEQRNYGGFNYRLYLKSIKIYGELKVDNVKKISSHNLNFIEEKINSIKTELGDNIKNNIDEKYQPILKGLILGDTTELKQEVKEDFQISNISHVLAVSGMHIVYIVSSIEMILKKILGKRKIKYISIIALIFYMTITGFTSSIVRAGIMGILNILAFLLYKKKDIWTSISLSLLVILINNPYAIIRYRFTVIIFRDYWYISI